MMVLVNLLLRDVIAMAIAQFMVVWILMLLILIQMQLSNLTMNLAHQHAHMQAVQIFQQQLAVYGKMGHQVNGGKVGGTAKADKFVV